MPAYKTGKKTNQYSADFKATAVKLTHHSGATVKAIAEAWLRHTLLNP